jgi:MFS transporter, DHA1 family, multidrug resistance protein
MNTGSLSIFFQGDLMNRSDKRIFATLFLSMFTVLTGVGIVVPLLPIYAHKLGAGGLYISLIFGVFSISRTIFLPYFGRASDKKGRKPFIVTGLLAYTLISFAFILADRIGLLIAIRFFQGIASAMIMPVVQAYIGDMTPAKQEGFIMGIFNMSVFIGLSLGPLLGGVINDHFGLSFSFLCMGILSFISFFLNLCLLPPVSKEKLISQKKAPAGWNFLMTDKDIVGLFIFRLAYTACIGMIWSFLPIYASAEFALSGSSVGTLVMLGIFVSGALQAPMGFIADRISKKAMIIAGGLIVVYAMFSFEWAKGIRDLFFSSVMFGIGGGMSMAPHTAIAVQKGNKIGAMGSVMGLMTMSHSIGMMAGSLIAGLMMEFLKLRQAFSLGAVMMIIGVLVFCLKVRSEK